MDSFAAFDVVDGLQCGEVLGEDGVADFEGVADGGELGFGDGCESDHELQSRGCEDVRVELGHQR
jgi:hypothetical protein